MTRALELARRGLNTTTPNPRVGCVIAAGERVLGEGFHARAGEAHAEIAALADARAHGADVRGATLYATLTPCNSFGRTPPCTGAIVAAGIGRVVAAMDDPAPVQAGAVARLREAGVRIDVGLLEGEAQELNRGFVSRLTRGRPWVRMKIAASLDGRTALDGGASQWITGSEAREDGHRWRARACAVLTGIGTVRHDDPQLTVRAIDTPRQPLRVVLDVRAETPPGARVLARPHVRQGDTPEAQQRARADTSARADPSEWGGGVLVVTAGARNPEWPAHVEVMGLPDANGRIDLGAAMRMLAARGINELHVEAGARLNGALLAAGLVDEVLVYLSPSLIGDPARGMFALRTPLASLDERHLLRYDSIERVGADLRILARVTA
ncbi:MAG: bifunctional diaminohydroxyphosphoribosylaminopyrimidine deaminase/5-amino-6-(5-phosphoribosylamino)uracil reductase RibD [Proteobacteria bacterium]|nr:bifunctional diaminohydroxyphosphoribosylaminopyrimidine deaminase/5-amino-6-(5-phosphoribosylamino)uracil reductase RibD [Pseudomonadota bacterium]